MKENISIKEAAYQFIDAISKVVKLDKEDTAKIVLYDREKPNDIITYSRELNFIDNLDFIARNENDIGDFTAIVKNDDIVYNCRIIDHDIEKKSYVVLMKPETTKTIKVIYDNRDNSEND